MAPNKLRVVIGVLLVAVHVVKPCPEHYTPGIVVGGQEALKGEFPHHVSIQKGSDGGPYRHSCGGSIINSQWILTSGGCARVSDQADRMLVKAGKHDLNTNEIGEQVIEIATSIIHERYHGGGDPYDIALLKLKTPLNLTELVAPINLPKNGTKPTGKGILSSWGPIAWDNTVYEAKLQKIVLPTFDSDTCKTLYKRTLGYDPLGPTQFCTGSVTGQETACSVNSGSSLIQKNASGAVEIIGISSWTIKFWDFMKYPPTMHIDVAQFIDWIQITLQTN